MQLIQLFTAILKLFWSHGIFGDKVVWGIFPGQFGFLCQLSFQQLLAHTINHPGIDVI
jgi:hypothetical protein